MQVNYFMIQFKFVILSRKCVTKYKAKENLFINHNQFNYGKI